MGAVQSKSLLVPWENNFNRRSCSECEIPFSIVNRRHHCRSCGRLVCEQCSPYTEYLWQLGLGDEFAFRVCALCASKSVNVISLERDAYAISCTAMTLVDSDSDVLLLELAADLIRNIHQHPTFNPYLFKHLKSSFEKGIFRVIKSITLRPSSRYRLERLVQRCREDIEMPEFIEPELEPARSNKQKVIQLTKSEPILIPSGSPVRNKVSKKHVQFSLEEDRSESQESH